MSTNVGTIDLDLILNSKSFKSQLNNAVNNSLKSVSKTANGTLSTSFAKFGKIALAAFSVKKIVEFGKQCVKLGSDIAEVQNVVDVSFGKMKQEMEDFASTSIEKFGMSQLSAKQTGSSYMAMAKGMGMASDSASDMALTLTGLSGDMASFYNINQSEARTALASVFTGETETLKRYGILLTEVNLQEYARQKGITKSIAKMTQQEKVMLRYNYVLNATQLAQGDFERTQKSWANQTRILSERFNNVKATLGQGLINALTPALTVLNKFMAYLQKAADAFSNFTAKVFGKQETGAGASASALADSIGDIGTAATDTASAVKKAQNSLAGFDKLNVIGSKSSESGGSSDGTLSMGLGNTESVGGSTEVEKTATGLDTLKAKMKGFFSNFKAEMSAASKQWGKTKANVLKVWNDLKNLGSPLKNWFTKDFISYVKTYVKTAGNIFVGLWDTANTVYGDIWNKAVYPRLKTFITVGLPVITQFSEQFVKTIGTLFNEVKAIVDDVWKDGIIPVIELGTKVFSDGWKIISANWKKHGQPIFDGIREAINKTASLVKDFWNKFLKPVWQSLVSAISDLWDKHLKPLVDKITDFVGELVVCALEIYNKFIAPIVQWLQAVLLPVFRNVFQTIINILKPIIGAIIDVVGGIITALKGVIQFITGIFTGNWSKAWEGVKNIFKGIWDGIWGIIKGVINLIIAGLNSLWSSVYKVFKGIVDGIGGAVGWIGELFGKDWGFSMPEKPPLIPALANGGYVEANTPQLAMIGDNRHEGEIVAPESKITEAVLAALGPIVDTLQQLGATIKALANGNGKNIVVQCILDGKVVYETVVKQNNSRFNQTGKSPLKV